MPGVVLGPRDTLVSPTQCMLLFSPKSHQTLCDPMDYRTAGFLAPHHLQVFPTFHIKTLAIVKIQGLL